MPDVTSENDDRSERRFVRERNPAFLLFGEKDSEVSVGQGDMAKGAWASAILFLLHWTITQQLMRHQVNSTTCGKGCDHDASGV